VKYLALGRQKGRIRKYNKIFGVRVVLDSSGLGQQPPAKSLHTLECLSVSAGRKFSKGSEFIHGLNFDV